MAKQTTVIKTKMTQAQIIQWHIENNQILKNITNNNQRQSKTIILSVLETQADLVVKSLKKGSCGMVTIPFLGVKFSKKIRKARKKGLGKSFDKEIMLPARKAASLVKATILKKLKDQVNF